MLECKYFLGFICVWEVQHYLVSFCIEVDYGYLSGIQIVGQRGFSRVIWEIVSQELVSFDSRGQSSRVMWLF